jgi:SsrA-binding protein
MAKKKKQTGSELVRNRRAYHDYDILETYEAGIVLVGSEVKSLRQHHASLQEAYVRIINNELYLIGCSILPYAHSGAFTPEERRDRKLLMHGYEIARLKTWVTQKGQTLVPLAFFLHRGRVKVRIGRAVGRKKADKRQAIREREMTRQMERAIKRED